MLRTSSLLLCAAPVLADANDFTVDAGRGPITVHVPDSYEAGTSTPLVVLLHGYSSSGFWQENYMNFLGVHEEYGFLYAHPNGTVDQWGYRFWNATNACCDFGGTGVDDSAYLAALLDAIEAAASVDPRRVYLIGHSNGGFMSYRMACDHSERIAAICSLAGAAHKNPNVCGATSPVHVLQIHGTEDATILYGGGQINGIFYPGAIESAEQWAANAGCDPVPDGSADPINLDKSIPGKETTILRYASNCDGAGSGEVWSIQAGEHVPSLSNPFTTHVIEWLYAHPKPGIDSERYCSPNRPNSTGLPGTLDASGSDALAHDDLTLTASDLPADQFGYFLASLDQGLVQPPGSAGNLCLANDVARFVTSLGNSGTSGVISAPISLEDVPTNPPQDVVTGQQWHFQLWHRDGFTSNFTDALSIRFR
jgi:polyhydroxybutyrate depolymerase